MARVVIVHDEGDRTAAGRALRHHVLLRLELAGHQVRTVDRSALRYPAQVPTDAAGTVLLTADALDLSAVRVVRDASRPVREGPLLVLRLDFDGPGAGSTAGAGAGSGVGVVAVPAADLRTFDDGGVVLAPTTALSVADGVDAFLAAVAGTSAPAVSRSEPGPRPRVSTIAGAPDLEVRLVGPDDPRLARLLYELKVEYLTRYALDGPAQRLTEVPPSDFELPHGTFVILQEGTEVIAGGAIRHFDELTAEVKRVWTSLRHRRRGLAARLMAELESTAGHLGYRRMHLTTGARQPEAIDLYLAAGYRPRYDPGLSPEEVGIHPFGKELVPGTGLVPWPPEPAELLPGSAR